MTSCLAGDFASANSFPETRIAADVVVGRFSFGRMLVSRSPFLAATDESLCLAARAIPRLRRVSEITGLRNVGNADLATAHLVADRGLFGPQQNSSAIRACVSSTSPGPRCMRSSSVTLKSKFSQSFERRETSVPRLRLSDVLTWTNENGKHRPMRLVRSAADSSSATKRSYSRSWNCRFVASAALFQPCQLSLHEFLPIG